MGHLHNCDYHSSRVGRIYSNSKTEPNMSEYMPDYLYYLFLVRQRRFERSPHYFINFLSHLSYGLKSIKSVGHT